jgi:hypothetical protein
MVTDYKPKAGMSPLWVISLFLSLTEVVTGIAVVQAKGGVQTALTAFAIGFPTLVAGIFFTILWHRPYVFYPPSDFESGADVQKYVDAMQRRTVDEKRLVEVVEETVRSSVTSVEVRQSFPPGLQTETISDTNVNRMLQVFADATLQRVHDQLLTVDLSRLGGGKSNARIVPFNHDRQVFEFLDDLWLSVAKHVPAYTYGNMWFLRDSESGKEFRELGQIWAHRNGFDEDHRTLAEVGFKPGMKLEAVRVRS